MYCEEEDLYSQFNKEVLVGFATESDDADDAYKDRIAALISAAEAEVNGYLAKQYKLPLTIVPDAVKNVTIDIAIYKILGRKGIKKDSEESIWIDRYKNAIKFLEGVRDGKNDIGIVTEEGVSSPSNYSFKSEEKVFDSDFWKGY
ncbi:MAG: DUF1320 domain-containing protein [Spirochaetes bacterium]|nr:DUF1320 domain-containing protein [Spirochaetota bacterium]